MRSLRIFSFYLTGFHEEKKWGRLPIGSLPLVCHGLDQFAYDQASSLSSTARVSTPMEGLEVLMVDRE